MLVEHVSEHKRCFAPVVNAKVRLLILGSLPGQRSLAQEQYYAHPQNQFWRLLSEVTGTDLPQQDYSTRLQSLLAHGIGLWDVVAQARRDGSLDSNIRERADNDLPALCASLEHLQAIAFNGATAARIGSKVLAAQLGRYQLISLPSSSPAYTAPYAEKLAIWGQLRSYALART